MYIDGVDDLARFNKTMEALTAAGFSGKSQSSMLKIFASILHLGDISISKGTS